MEALEKVAGVLRTLTTTKKSKRCCARIIVSNGSDIPLKLCEDDPEKPVAEKGVWKYSFTSELAPGRAGIIRLEGHEGSDMGGAVSLMFCQPMPEQSFSSDKGQRSSQTQALNPRVTLALRVPAQAEKEPSFVARLVAGPARILKTMKRHYFMGLKRPQAIKVGRLQALVSCLVHSDEVIVHVVVGLGMPLHPSLLALEMNECERLLEEAEALTTKTAEWNVTISYSLFFEALACSQVALNNLRSADRLFALDLLAEAFISTQVLRLDEGELEDELSAWRRERELSWEKAGETPPSIVSDLFPRGPYQTYRQLGMLEEETFDNHLDAVLILVRTAVLRVINHKRLLDSKTEAILQRQHTTTTINSFGRAQIVAQISELPVRILCLHCGWRKRSRPKLGSATSDSGGNGKLSCNDQLMTQVMRRSRSGNISEAEFPSRSSNWKKKKKSVSSSVDVDISRLLQEKIRGCIQVCGMSRSRREALLAQTVEMLSPEDRAHLQRYADLIPGTRRQLSQEPSGLREFETWGAEVFASLDSGGVVSPEKVEESLGMHSPDYQVMSVNSKSGEYFFFSGDRRFLLKTISEDEAVLLFRMLADYKCHMMYGKSLLVRVGGLYRILVEKTWIHFMVMASVFDPRCPVTQVFDVKGSTYNRKAKPGESVGKDSDWTSTGQRLLLNDKTRRSIRSAHERDATFLERFHVMDYSVLVGIHKVADSSILEVERDSDWREEYGVYGSKASGTIYFIGIIDFLIYFGVKKSIENIFRVAQGQGMQASAVHPRDYAIRQVSFVRHSLLQIPGRDPQLDPYGCIGTVSVKVASAKGLRNADWVGKSDPYCRVELGFQQDRTQTIWNDLNPKWDCQMYFALDALHLKSALHFSVWDQDVKVSQGSDDFLGEIYVKLSDFIYGETPVIESDFKLEKVSTGYLSVRIEYISETGVVSL